MSNGHIKIKQCQHEPAWIVPGAVEVCSKPNNQSWDSVPFWFRRYQYSVLENGNSVSVFRYFAKVGHSVSVSQFRISILLKKPYACKNLKKTPLMPFDIFLNPYKTYSKRSGIFQNL